MAVERINDMTIDELKLLIKKEIDERLRDAQRIQELLKRPQDHRSLEAILDSIEQHRLTPPPGSKSTLELLREDRDR